MRLGSKLAALFGAYMALTAPVGANSASKDVPLTNPNLNLKSFERVYTNPGDDLEKAQLPGLMASWERQPDEASFTKDGKSSDSDEDVAIMAVCSANQLSIDYRRGAMANTRLTYSLPDNKLTILNIGYATPISGEIDDPQVMSDVHRFYHVIDLQEAGTLRDPGKGKTPVSFQPDEGIDIFVNFDTGRVMAMGCAGAKSAIVIDPLLGIFFKDDTGKQFTPIAVVMDAARSDKVQAANTPLVINPYAALP